MSSSSHDKHNYGGKGNYFVDIALSNYSMGETRMIPSEFYFACRNGNLDLVIQSLTELAFEDLDRMEPNNSTALHAACYYKHVDIIRLLLDRGFTRCVHNKFNLTPIDETTNEEIRQLFLRSDQFCRFVCVISDEREIFLWMNIDGNQPKLITDVYNGNRLEYGIFHDDKICQQLNSMPKLDVIRRYFRRAIEEKDCTRLIQAYTAETNFYDHVNNYLLIRNEQEAMLQFVQTIYFNRQLHEKYSYKGLAYRSVRIDSIDQLPAYEKGSKILNRTFLSTTRTRHIAEEYSSRRSHHGRYTVMMIFKIRHDYTALDIARISEFPHEEEILIMFDSIFEVKDVIPKENFSFEMKLDQIKSNHRK